MTLDLLQVAPQIGAMAREVGARRRALAQRREQALALLRAWDTRSMSCASWCSGSNPGWWPSRWSRCSRRTRRRPFPPISPWWPPTAALSTWIGMAWRSAILINVGAAVIRYGAAPAAALSARAALYYRDDDLYLDDAWRARARARRAGRPQAHAGRAGSARWSCARTCARAGADRGGGRRHAVAVAAQRPRRRGDVCGRGHRRVCRRPGEFRRLDVPVCSYVSRPNGREVVNLLRLADARRR